MHAFAQYTVLALTAATSLVQAGSSAHRPRRLEQSQQHAKRENHLQKRFTGKFSYYDAQTGNQGACGGFIQNTEWTVALNSAQWDGGSHCGQQVTINYNGNVQVATIRDMCPGCGYGGLDLTPSLFAAFASHDVGLIYPTWNFGGNSDPAPSPPPPSPSTTWRPEPTTSQWTPEWTPPAPSTSSTRWSSTPEYTWTPPSSSRTPSSTWTPPSSSERPHSSSSSSHSSWSSSSSPSSTSSSSSSLVFSPSAVANATLTGLNATSTEMNSTVAATALTTVTLGNGTVATSTLSPGVAGAANTGSPLHNSPSGTGSLANFNQVVLQLANLVVQAAEE